MAKLLTKQELENIVTTALKGLSASGPLRLTICKLVEHIEALTEIKIPPEPKIIDEHS